MSWAQIKPAYLSRKRQNHAIGPETSKAIAALGLKPKLEAKEHTTDGLIAALLKGK